VFGLLVIKYMRSKECPSIVHTNLSLSVDEQSTESIDWNEYWNPKLYVDNCVGELKETIGRSVVYDVKTWEAFVVERRRLKGTFLENLELFHFPFDTQVPLS